MLRLIGFLVCMGLAFYAGTQYKGKVTKQAATQQAQRLLDRVSK